MNQYTKQKQTQTENKLTLPRGGRGEGQIRNMGLTDILYLDNQ